MQVDAEARIVAPFEHAGRLVLHALAAGKAAADCLEDLFRVHSGLLREGHPLGHRRDVDRHDGLVDEFRRLSRAEFADERALAHKREDVLHLLVRGFGAPHHDGQGSLLGLLLPSADRSVEHLRAFFGEHRSQFAARKRRDGAHVDDDLPFLRSFQDAVLAADDLADVRGVRQHGNDDVRLFRDVFR